MSRAEYVASLQVERASLASRKDSPVRTRRLAEVDAALAEYSDAPATRKLETRTDPAPAAAPTKRAPRRRAARKA